MIGWLERFYARRALSHHGHSFADYTVACSMIVAPWIFGFSDIITVRNCWLLFGLTLATYSFLTDYYEVGGYRVIRFPLHRFCDLIIAALLLTAESLFLQPVPHTRFQAVVHYVFVALLILMAVFSKTRRVDLEKYDELPHRDYAA